MGSQPNVVSLLEAGIQAASMRQSAIANNIANLETPNYRRFDVKFEDVLANAIDGPGDAASVEPELTRPRETPVDSKGNDVNMEMEIGNLIKNAGRYKAYIRLLNKTYRQMEMAMGQK